VAGRGEGGDAGVERSRELDWSFDCDARFREGGVCRPESPIEDDHSLDSAPMPLVLGRTLAFPFPLPLLDGLSCFCELNTAAWSARTSRAERVLPIASARPLPLDAVTD